MNKWAEILLGLILVIAAILVWGYSANWNLLGVSFNFGNAAWEVLKGGAILFLIMVCLLFLMLGISDLNYYSFKSLIPNAWNKRLERIIIL